MIDHLYHPSLSVPTVAPLPPDPSLVPPSTAPWNAPNSRLDFHVKRLGYPSLIVSGCRAAPSLVASGYRAAPSLILSGCDQWFHLVVERRPHHSLHRLVGRPYHWLHVVVKRPHQRPYDWLHLVVERPQQWLHLLVGRHIWLWNDPITGCIEMFTNFYERIILLSLSLKMVIL